MRILLVEDEEKLGSSLSKILTAEQYTVDWCKNGEDALEYIYVESYDLAIFDIGLPDMTGFDLLKTIRSEGYDVSVLFLTAQDAIEMKVEGLDLGAQDYVVKPFDIEELLARIRALIRIHTVHTSAVLRCGELSIDTSHKRVTLGDQEIRLSLREYTLLTYLMLNKNQLLDKQRILDQVWGEGVDPFSKVVDVYIGYLRKKLSISKSSSGVVIETIKGMGYKLSCND